MESLRPPSNSLAMNLLDGLWSLLAFAWAWLQERIIALGAIDWTAADAWTARVIMWISGLGALVALINGLRIMRRQRRKVEV